MWNIFSRKRTVKVARRRSCYKPRLESLEERTLLDGDGIGFLLPPGAINPVAPAHLRDLSSNAYWQNLTKPMTHSTSWLMNLAPSLSQSVHFQGTAFGDLEFQPQYLNGNYGTQVHYTDNFTVNGILDPGSTTTVTIDGTITIGNASSKSITLSATFTDSSFLGTPCTLTVNSSTNSGYNIVGWSGSATLSGSNVLVSGDNVSGSFGLSQPQSPVGSGSQTYQTDLTYSAPNLMASGDQLKSHIWSAGNLQSGNFYANYLNADVSYLGNSLFATNDQASVTLSLRVDASGNYTVTVGSSYTGAHIFNPNDQVVIYLNFNQPANWAGNGQFGLSYNVGGGFNLNTGYSGLFGSSNPYGTMPTSWSVGGDYQFSPGNNMGFDFNSGGGMLRVRFSY